MMRGIWYSGWEVLEDRCEDEKCKMFLQRGVICAVREGEMMNIHGKHVKQKLETIAVSQLLLDKRPLQLEDTLGQRGKLLESLAREIELTVAAVTMRAGINDTNHDGDRRTLGSDTNLLAALGTGSVLLTHLSLVQGNDHVILREILSAGTTGVTEPSTTTMVDGARVALLLVVILLVLLLFLLLVLILVLRLDSGLLLVIVVILISFVLGLDELPLDINTVAVSEGTKSTLGKVQRLLLAILAEVDDLVNVMIIRAIGTVDLDVLTTKVLSLETTKLVGTDGYKGLVQGVIDISTGTTDGTIIVKGSNARILLVDHGDRRGSGVGDGGSHSSQKGSGHDSKRVNSHGGV